MSMLRSPYSTKQTKSTTLILNSLCFVFQDGKVVIASNRIRIMEVYGTHSLVVSRADSNDTGVYSATATNHLGSESCTANLNVTGKLNIYYLFVYWRNSKSLNAHMVMNLHMENFKKGWDRAHVPLCTTKNPKVVRKI